MRVKVPGFRRATYHGDIARLMVQHVTRWLGAEDPDADVRLPLGVLPATNGEYVPDLPTRRERDVAASALMHADEAAGRAGMDRRRFLQTAGGVAAVLATIDLAACSSPSGRASPTRASTSASTGTT